MRTVKFSATVGVNEGYSHNNEIKNPLEIVGTLWQEIAESHYKKCNIYISAIITDSKTIYSPNWGCPTGGEDTITISGSCNPEFSNPEDWRKSVISVLKEMKEKLKQSTVTIEFWEIDSVYMTD